MGLQLVDIVCGHNFSAWGIFIAHAFKVHNNINLPEEFNQLVWFLEHLFYLELFTLEKYLTVLSFKVYSYFVFLSFFF